MGLELSYDYKGATHASAYHRIRYLTMFQEGGLRCDFRLDTYADKAARDENMDNNILKSRSFIVNNVKDENGDPVSGKQYFDDYLKVAGDSKTAYDYTLNCLYQYLKDQAGFGDAADV